MAKKLIKYVLPIVVVFMAGNLMTMNQAFRAKSINSSWETVRKISISSERLCDWYVSGDREKWIKRIALSAVSHKYQVKADDDIPGFPYTSYVDEKLVTQAFDFYATILMDVRCFPVRQDTKGNETFEFDNSWGGKRSYGGDRLHEGCDIMTSNNEPGYFEIQSMTDGVVEEKGWLKLGGYRIGVRSPSGAYYYYAHLDRYAEEIEKGDKVKAGDLLGYMGDSGYGEEGTKGKFDVHLHMGIYITRDKEEMAVNPYEILKFIKKMQLQT